MPIEILMPALSPTMTEGNLVKWLKKEGDSVASGEVIAEIETDKATMEVESVDEGKIGKIFIPEGTESVKVNTLIALLLEEGETAADIDGYAPSAVSEAPTTKAEVQSVVSSSQGGSGLESLSGARVFASPLAKRMAAQGSIDLAKVQGSGPKGRVIKTDVEIYKPSSVSNSVVPMAVGSVDRSFVDHKLSNMRKVIASRLTESKQTIPHFYLNVSCEIDNLLALRTEVNSSRENEARISVNDFVIKAMAMALATTPDANVMWMGDSLREFSTVDMSVAVAIDGGLVTPIIKDAQVKTLSQISSEMRDLAARARDGALKPEEFQGGSFTISNLGMYGIEHFGAIVNPPQAGILAVGAGVKMPVVRNETLEMATVMKVTLSVDHRAIDGAVGAKLLTNFKKFVEHPVKMLI